MPTRITIPEDANREGIDITWTPSAQRISIGGWYDTCVGICQTERMSLRQFFDKLGITERDCKKAFSTR